MATHPAPKPPRSNHRSLEPGTGITRRNQIFFGLYSRLHTQAWSQVEYRLASKIIANTSAYAVGTVWDPLQDQMRTPR